MFTGSVAELFATMGLDASGFTQGLTDIKVGLLSAEQATKVYQEALKQFTQVFGISINEANAKIASHVSQWNTAVKSISSQMDELDKVTARPPALVWTKRVDEAKVAQAELNKLHEEAIQMDKSRELSFKQLTAAVSADEKRQQQSTREWANYINAQHEEAILMDRAREASIKQVTDQVVFNNSRQIAATKEWQAYMNAQHTEALKEDKERTASDNGWFGNRVGWMQRMILHMAAFTVAFKAFQAIEEGLGDFANLQKAEVALTHMLGSAQAASVALEQLRVIALSDGLDFQHLIKAQLRFSEFGVDAAKIPPILEAAANTAAAMNKPFDEVSNSLERMTESGVANARQLATIGLKLSDLGAVMGVTGKEVAAIFKDEEMTASERAQIFTEALSKLDGVAKTASTTLGPEWIKTKETFGFAMTEMIRANELWIASLEKGIRYALLYPQIAKTLVGAISHGGALDFSHAVVPVEGVPEVSGWFQGSSDNSSGEVESSKDITARIKATQAAKKAYEEMVASEIGLHNKVVELLNSQADTYDEYVARLAVGGRTAKESLSAIQTAIQHVSSEMLNFKGVPLTGAKELLVWLEDAKVKAKEFADQDLLPKLEEDRLKSLDKALQFFNITVEGTEAKAAKARDAFNTIKAEWMLGEASIEAVTQAQTKLNEVMGTDFLEKAITGVGLLNQKFEKTNESIAAQKALLRSPEFSERSRQIISDLGSTESLKKVLDATKLQDAYHTLGVKTQEELDKLAAKALAAFNTIQASGTASAWTTQQAWLRSFEAQMDAGQKFTFFQVLGASLIADNSRSASSKLLSVARETSREITRLTRELASSLVDNLAKVFDTSSNDSVQKQLDGLDAQRKDHEATYLQDVKDTQNEIDAIRAGAGTSIAANKSAAKDIEALQDKLAKEKAAYDKFVLDTRAQSDEIRKQFQNTWDKIGNAFEKTVEGFAKALAKFAAQKLIESALAAPLEALGVKLAGLAGIGKAAGSVSSFPGAMDAGISAASGVYNSISGVTKNVGDVTSQATQTAGSAASGVFGAIGGISAAVGAVSSIVGNFQMAGMNKSLDLIEKSTRYSELYLFNLNTVHLTYLPKLDYLLPIWGAILELPNRMVAAPSAGGSGDTYIFQAGSISITGGTALTPEVASDLMTQAVRKLKISKGLRQ